jgi:hypothetical protein
MNPWNVINVRAGVWVWVGVCVCMNEGKKSRQFSCFKNFLFTNYAKNRVEIS